MGVPRASGTRGEGRACVTLYTLYHGTGVGQGEKTGKIKWGGGVGNERKKPVVPNFRTAGRRIRWRVPELTPNTPGPAASADY